MGRMTIRMAGGTFCGLLIAAVAAAALAQTGGASAAAGKQAAPASGGRAATATGRSVEKPAGKSAAPPEPVLGQPVETPETAAQKAKRRPPPAGVRDLGWEDLIPKHWNPRAVLDRLGIDALSDSDPRAADVLAKIRADWDRAPVVKSLDGQKVRLPGYVVMLDGDEKGVTEFLLVPYFGACIHLPPPPSSQVVHVFPRRLVPEKVAMFPVWASGTLRTVQADTALGSAGYRMQDAVVEAYPMFD